MQLLISTNPIDLDCIANAKRSKGLELRWLFIPMLYVYFIIIIYMYI